MIIHSPAQRPESTVRIIFRIGDMDYAVVPLRPDMAVARKAYRLRKQGGDHAVYDVSLRSYGPECECLGFLRWNRPCKHIRTLQVAGML
jgi:hypothetical protein